MDIYEKLDTLCRKCGLDIENSVNTEMPFTNEQRLLFELYYALSVSKSKNNKYEEIIENAADKLYSCYLEQGAVTRNDLFTIEEILKPMEAEAKSYSILCIGHAHIDMNWMWGQNETVVITHDTMRTVLDLMNQYAGFTYAQSQASTYRIMEEYFPEMLPEVKMRINEGRWEVIASTWVEADRNMPNAESMARHLLYTKRYLSELLEIEADSLNLDFEPDTFGHNANTPEILTKGGVKYYYHSRGGEGTMLYRWRAESGAYITAFCEPIWYNHTITGHAALKLMEFCRKYDMDSMLRVYGVGDHGGGPTRRDIERIIEMNKWPIFPNWEFSSFKDFFKLTENIQHKLPEIIGELNYIFTGCYTSQSLVKKNNKLCEPELTNTEMWNTIANGLVGAPYENKNYEKHWRKALFNQFHDILPGSGVAATIRYADGLAQEVLAFTGINLSKSLRALSDSTNTEGLIQLQDYANATSQGAGAGFGLESKSGEKYSRHYGKDRLFTVFNMLPYKRKELAEVVLWDWEYDTDGLYFTDSDNAILCHQKTGQGSYWRHKYIRCLVETEVGATGYATLAAKYRTKKDLPSIEVDDPRKNASEELILENEYIMVRFDGKIRAISFIDKSSGIDYAKKEPIGFFGFINEDPSKEMTAWRVGRYMEYSSIRNIKVKSFEIGQFFLRQSIVFEAEFGNSSRMNVEISLDKEQEYIAYDVCCKWKEFGDKESGIPQLQFKAPVFYEYEKFTYDIPLGLMERKPADHDVPAQNFAMANAQNGKSLVLISDSKYGFRGDESGLAIDLIRGSYDPDPYPETGEHKFRIALSASSSKIDAKMKSLYFCSPLRSVSATAHKGKMQCNYSFIEVVEGDIVICAYKKSETDGNATILRLYNVNPEKEKIKLKLRGKKINTANMADIHEKIMEGDVKIDLDTIIFNLKPNCICTIIIT